MDHGAHGAPYVLKGFSLVEPGRRVKAARRQRRMLREPEGQTDWGVFSFGYFSLDKQRKVTRQQGETKCLVTHNNKLTNQAVGHQLNDNVELCN